MNTVASFSRDSGRNIHLHEPESPVGDAKGQEEFLVGGYRFRLEVWTPEAYERASPEDRARARPMNNGCFWEFAPVDPG